MVLNSYLHTKIQYITKMSRWKAGQSFLAKIDYFFKVDHISKKLTLALFDIRPTTLLVCTLVYMTPCQLLFISNDYSANNLRQL